MRASSTKENFEMFYLIGLGLGDEKDITVRGLEIVKKCKKVFLEEYTAIFPSIDKKRLEEFYGREVISADRDVVETQCEQFFENAMNDDVALLVVGDPFSATTHTDLILRAKEKSIPVKIIHNTSIITAVASCGLQLYNFGQIVSIPFFSEKWKPSSFLDKVEMNRNISLHTLCLLDIKVKERSEENLLKNRNIFEPPRYLSCKGAAEQIIDLLKMNEKKKIEKQKRQEEEKKKAGSDSEEEEEIIVKEWTLTEDSLCIGLARIGDDSEKIVVASLKQMSETDLGPPLHSLIIPADHIHPLENDYLSLFKLK